MLNADEFDGLAVGDLVTAVPLFPALSKDPVILRTAQKAADQAKFVVTYHGVTLGSWVAEKDSKGVLKWALG